MIPILTSQTFGWILEHTGVAMTGSYALFGLLVLAGLMYVMVKLNIPIHFIFISIAFVGSAMAAIWGNPTVRIVGFIVAIIFGYIVGSMILRAFNRGGE